MVVSSFAATQTASVPVMELENFSSLVPTNEDLELVFVELNGSELKSIEL